MHNGIMILSGKNHTSIVYFFFSKKILNGITFPSSIVEAKNLEIGHRAFRRGAIFEFWVIVVANSNSLIIILTKLMLDFLIGMCKKAESNWYQIELNRFEKIKSFWRKNWVEPLYEDYSINWTIFKKSFGLVQFNYLGKPIHTWIKINIWIEPNQT